jgi:CheY-like chemotaxis protein
MVILFVDDDLEEYDLFCEAIKTFRPATHCLYAKDGLAAIDLLHRLSALPDYIFLDINMPVMNGRECLNEIKADNRLNTIPVIMYSTTANPAEISSFEKLGAQDFIIKPSGFNQLISRLKTMLKPV